MHPSRSGGKGVPAAHAAVVIAAGRVGEHIIVAVRAGRVGAGLGKPPVAAAGMVQHVIHINADSLGFRLGNQVLEVGFGTELRVDGGIIRHVVAVVGHRRLHRRQPQGAHAQALEIVQVLGHAFEVAPAVAVGIGEAVHVDLVGDVGEVLTLLDVRRFAAGGFAAGLVAGEQADGSQREAGQDAESSHIGHWFQLADRGPVKGPGPKSSGSPT